MEYKIKKQQVHRLPVYLANSFLTRSDAENFLEEINNEDPDIVYSIVYGKSYPWNGTFAEFPEPIKK
ncbi:MULTISPECIES: hypothetical protein [Flavobacterium]|uniref:Uncharacterized protein n=1 Tax=Flavobacterium tructae TaxID=1114873 RepID=A0A1S1JA23_9FLAO|nr:MULTISPECIES: hypothetical protein [Flavobacterium]OHT46411.1 hypothetical protein BHE19_02585 [Flavobacterium tructae]OXB22373.1 hypothetical protein B0A71_02630 [Flavobacterium tructae]URC13790.1 hypothetical protein M4I44_05160 [Flavobacterium sp. B183]